MNSIWEAQATLKLFCAEELNDNCAIFTGVFCLKLTFRSRGIAKAILVLLLLLMMIRHLAFITEARYREEKLRVAPSALFVAWERRDSSKSLLAVDALTI